jgi:hypothetical protein
VADALRKNSTEPVREEVLFGHLSDRSAIRARVSRGLFISTVVKIESAANAEGKLFCVGKRALRARRVGSNHPETISGLICEKRAETDAYESIIDKHCTDNV